MQGRDGAEDDMGRWQSVHFGTVLAVPNPPLQSTAPPGDDVK